MISHSYCIDENPTFSHSYCIDDDPTFSHSYCIDDKPTFSHSYCIDNPTFSHNAGGNPCCIEQTKSVHTDSENTVNKPVCMDWHIYTLFFYPVTLEGSVVPPGSSCWDFRAVRVVRVCCCSACFYLKHRLCAGAQCRETDPGPTSCDANAGSSWPPCGWGFCMITLIWLSILIVSDTYK